MFYFVVVLSKGPPPSISDVIFSIIIIDSFSDVIVPRESVLVI